VTIEYDDASVEMCAHNPYSQALFTSENGHNNLVGYLLYTRRTGALSRSRVSDLASHFPHTSGATVTCLFMCSIDKLVL
jgi:hypothetical protein